MQTAFRFSNLLLIQILIFSFVKLAAQDIKPAGAWRDTLSGKPAKQVLAKASPILLFPGTLPDSTVARIAASKRTVHKHFDPQEEKLLDSVKHLMRERVESGKVKPQLHDGAGLKTLGVVPKINRSFEGNNFNGVRPMDNAIAISDSGWIVSVVNTSISYTDVNGNVALNSRRLSEFYVDLGLPSFYFDPRVMYDPVADRFILVSLHGNTPAQTKVIISFSKSQNPEDGWWTYSFVGNFANPDTWFDYPQIGISQEDLYITGNLFDENDTYDQSVLMQLDKEVGYAGGMLDYNFWDQLSSPSGSNVGSVKPVSHGFGEGYGPGIYLLSSRSGSGTAVFLLEISNDFNNAPELFSSVVPCPFYVIGSDADQKGSDRLLDVGDCRMQMAYFDGRDIHYVHHNQFGNTGYNGFRYGRLNTANLSLVVQDFGAAGYGYAYPAVAPFSQTAAEGEVLIAFTRSATNTFPEFRAITADSSAFSPWGSVSIKSGESPIVVGGSNSQRWGDYSGICRRYESTQPSIWIFGTYGKNNSYGNWIAELIPGDTAQVDCPTLAEVTNCAGTLEDGSGASDYGNNLACSWVINPGNALSITLSFTEFNTQVDRDFVRVYDGADASAPLLGAFSGDSIPDTLIAQTGIMFIEFSTDSAGVASGWKANYTCVSNDTMVVDPCNQNTLLTNCNGTVADGSGNSDYISNLLCSWIISPPGATEITLTFTAFDTEFDYDFVEVFDGTSDAGTLLGAFSGEDLPAPLTAFSGSMFIRFATDELVNESGWEASYFCVQDTIQPGCDGDSVLVACSGTISDGSGAGNYSDDSYCTWTIAPPGATSITLEFTEFATESGYDFVRVYSGSNSTAVLIGEFSGNALPTTVTAYADTMLVIFTSDNFLNDAGWTASYTCDTTVGGSCQGNVVLTDCSGTIEDGSGDSNYSNNLECSWTIIPPGATSITLEFTAFQTETGFDFVEVYEGPDANGTLLGTFDGAFLPNMVVSNTGAMYIRFYSDDNFTYSGWSANYTCDTATVPGTYCQGDTLLTDCSGSISDGSGTESYLSGSDCGWLINPPGATSITLIFSEFNTESGFDFVRVYDGTDSNAPLLASYSGNGNQLPVTSTSGVMYVRFTSDNTVNDLGWSALYFCDTTALGSSCTGDTVLTLCEGGINDGSFASNYTNNLNCTWTIAPPGAKSVTVNFSSFETELGNDWLYIFDGDNIGAPLLGQFSGNAIPGELTALSGKMYLVFTTDADTTFGGWQLIYTCDTVFVGTCVSADTLTSCMGALDDGSGPGDYLNDQECSWLIAPPNALTVALEFTQFDTEEDFDYVWVYDGADTSGTLLGEFSGQALPPVLTAVSGKMYIRFESDDSFREGGWSATYSCVSATNQPVNIPKYSIFPNPAQNQLYLKIDMERAGRGIFEIFSADGRNIGRLFDGTIQAGKHTIPMNLEAFPSGIYQYRLILEQQNLQGIISIFR